MGTLLFGTIALAQALVLRGRVPAGGRWVLFSILAGALGMGVLMLLMSDIVETASSVLVQLAVFGLIGLCLGVAQWLVLRPLTARAAWWVLISAIAVGLAFVALFLIGGEGRELLTVITTGVILGVVSGTGLVWLLRGNETANP